MNAIETHPLPPFLPENAKILMLGSFPPPQHRWKMNFYYPNFNNDMWRIFGLVFFGDKDYFIDLANLLAQIPHCQIIITAGELATQTLLAHFRLPEKSRPNLRDKQPTNSAMADAFAKLKR